MSCFSGLVASAIARAKLNISSIDSGGLFIYYCTEGRPQASLKLDLESCDCLLLSIMRLPGDFNGISVPGARPLRSLSRLSSRLL